MHALNIELYFPVVFGYLVLKKTCYPTEGKNYPIPFSNLYKNKMTLGYYEPILLLENLRLYKQVS